jgi:hypothetical protein
MIWMKKKQPNERRFLNCSLQKDGMAQRLIVVGKMCQVFT